MISSREIDDKSMSFAGILRAYFSQQSKKFLLLFFSIKIRAKSFIFQQENQKQKIT